MKHPKSTEMMRGVRVLSVISYPTGETTILKIGPVHPDGDGSFAWAEVIHTLPHNEIHPFATHMLIYDDEAGRFAFSHGDYFETVDGALADFKHRTGGA
jgi:hypothetical protein